MIDEVWNQQWMDTRIPKGAQINILNPSYVRQEGGKLIFSKDEKAIGDYNSKDPDGGRSIYGAATVTLDGTEILFQYQAKYWTGLQALVRRVGEEFFSSPTFDDELPKWAVQEED